MNNQKTSCQLNLYRMQCLHRYLWRCVRIRWWWTLMCEITSELRESRYWWLHLCLPSQCYQLARGWYWWKVYQRYRRAYRCIAKSLSNSKGIFWFVFMNQFFLYFVIPKWNEGITFLFADEERSLAYEWFWKSSLTGWQTRNIRNFSGIFLIDHSSLGMEYIR
jgi:hypothetical protein